MYTVLKIIWIFPNKLSLFTGERPAFIYNKSCKAQKPDIQYTVASAPTRDRYGLYAEIQIVFGTVCIDYAKG